MVYMKKKIAKVLAVLLSGLVIFSSVPLSGYAEGTEPEKVVAQLKGRGFKEVVDLGDVATDPSLISAAFGKENGRDVVYSTATGGKFNAIDVKDNKLLFWAQLEGVSQVWSHTIAPDGTVYIVALGPGNEGQLWSYKPATKTVTKIGRVEASGQQVWSSTTDEAGNIYIGTYGDQKPGKIIKYDPVTNQFTDFGEIDSECAYVRSIAYHDGYLYAGLGVAAKVYRINVATGEKEEITQNVPEIISKVDDNGNLCLDIRQYNFCYDMAVVANRYLFARFDADHANAVLFYDLEEQKWLHYKLAAKNAGGTDIGCFGFTQIPVHNNKAYIIYNKQIQEIDIDSLSTSEFKTRSTGIEFPAAWRGGAFVNLGTEEAPEWALATIKRDGSIFYVKNIETATDEDKVSTPSVAMGSPLTLHNLHKANDGNLYMTTYPGGPKGARFDPRTNTFITYSQGQAEGIVAGNGTDLYFGIYPGAVIQKMNTDTLQVETLFELKPVYEQDRPYIMQFIDNRLFIGTIPDYGKLGGTLTIYDPQTNERKTYRNIIEDQSIVGIAYKNGKIYGSTTIRGGLNIDPTAQRAVMFVWDEEEEKLIKTIDLKDVFNELNQPPMISGLTFDKDGLLWGAVDGILFAMDPDTYAIVKSKNIYPNIKDRGMWRPVHILFGEDGLIYTDIGGKLTVVDPGTLDFVTLVGSGKEVDWIALAKDAKGNENIYFIQNGSNLNMIEVIDGGEVEEPPAATMVNVPLRNASFEQDLNKDGSIPGWSSLFALTDNVSFEVSSERAKTGSKSLKIVDKATNETVFVQSDPIPVNAGYRYTASTKLYLVDGSATFFIRFFDDEGRQVGTDTDGVNIIHVRSGYGEWQTVEAVVDAPAGAKYCRLYAGMSNYFTTPGAYYDDFKLAYEYQPVVNIPLTNAGLEEPVSGDSIPGWSSLSTITDNVSLSVSNERAKTGNNSIKITDGSQNEQVYAQSDPIPVTVGIKYTATVEMYLEDGSASFYIRFFDDEGKQVGSDTDTSLIHIRSGYGEWKTVQAVAVAPAGAKYCRLFAGASNYFTTSGAYYDDFRLSCEVPLPEEFVINVPILNPEFDAPIINGVIPGWSPITAGENVSVELVNKPGSSTEKCFKIVDLSNESEAYIASDMIPVQAGIEYTASVDLYLESKEIIGQSRSVMILRFYDEDGNQIGIDKDARVTVEVGQESWQTLTLVKVAPAGAKYVRILGGITPVWMSPGAYYDNFRLTYSEPVPETLSPGTLLLGLTEEQVEKENEFEVAVKYFGSEAKNLYAFDAVVNYDPAKLEFVSARKAGYYDKDSAEMMYNSATPGTVHVVSTLTGNDVASENGDVVILKFKALTSTGKTNITLSKDSKMVSAASNIQYPVGMDKVVTIEVVDEVLEPEDVNRDGVVDFDDVVSVAKNVGAGLNENNSRMDINGDGRIDIRDVGLVMLRYLNL